MRDPIVLCGLGKVGLAILETLHRQNETVIVITREIHPDWARRAQQMAARLILADARDDEVLKEAGISQARALILATSDDLTNLTLAMEAQKLSPKTPIVLRLCDLHLAEQARQGLNIRAAFDTAALSSDAFVAAALGEEVLAASCQTAPVVRGQKPDRHACRKSGRRSQPPSSKHPRVDSLLRLHRILLRVSPPIQAVRIAMIALAMLGVLVFHLSPLRLGWLDAFYFTITIMSTVGFGDIHLLHQPGWLKLFGCLLMMSGPTLVMIYFSLLTDYLVSRRFEEALRKPGRPLADHIVVVGLGDLGYHVATQLHERGEPVVVVECDRENAFVVRLPEEIPVIYGDIHQAQRMQEAGLERARAVLILTGNDRVNLRIAQRTKSLAPRVKTIVRLFDFALASRLDVSLFGIDLAINPSQAAAGTFVAALTPGALPSAASEATLMSFEEKGEMAL